MSKKTIQKIQGYVGVSGLQFHVWRKFIVFGDDNYSMLDNTQLHFVPASSMSDEQDMRYAATDAAAEMFKTSRGVWSHNSRIYVFTLYLDENKVQEDDTIDLQDIEYDDCARIYEIFTTPDLIRVGSFKCLLDEPSASRSNFVTKECAEEYLSKYRESAPDWKATAKDPADLCDAEKVYYLDPCYGALDAISVRNATYAGTNLLQDILHRTRYDLPKESKDNMKFPATITCMRQHCSCTVDLIDMTQDATIQDIETALKDSSVQQVVLEWAINQYTKIAQWYIADIIASGESYGQICLREWPVSCDYMDKDAFITNLTNLSEHAR